MMKHDVARYDTYKDSGVEWIGETPFQWVITRNKEIFEERGNLSNSGAETLLTVSHITGVTRRSEKNVNMFMAETMEGYKLCEKGDLIINTMWAWMGALGTTNENGICSPAYGVYKPRKYQPYNHRYFDYLYRTPNSITEMTRNSKGIVSSRLRLYPKDFFQMKTALPNYETQKAIADYLDTKTAQIDQKIDLLTQKATQYDKLKQSLINETVTRGLDKTVAMRDSGVEWIGEVPEHWEVKRVSDLAKIVNGYPFDSNLFDPTKGMPLIRIRDLNKTEAKTYYNGDFVESAAITADDVLIGMDGDFNVGRWYGQGRALLNQRMCCVRGINYLITRLLEYALPIHLQIINDVTHATTVKHLSSSQVEKIFIALSPDETEQKAIADYLDTKTAHIDRIVETINTQIDKLKELRKTLINDVVTGKIKVAMEGTAV